MPIDDYQLILRDALRLLFIIDAAAAPVAPADAAPPGAVGVVQSETRLQALDFWMRNPDYLAEELMDAYEAGSRDDGLDLVGSILTAEEPDLRREPMIRFKFGAYEDLEPALSILLSRALIDIRRAGDALHGIRKTHYFLMPAGRAAAQDLVAHYPVLGWYRDRAALVAAMAGATPAGKIKERQYRQSEYAETPLGALIPPIDARVSERYAALCKRAVA